MKQSLKVSVNLMRTVCVNIPFIIRSFSMVYGKTTGTNIKIRLFEDSIFTSDGIIVNFADFGFGFDILGLSLELRN